MQSLRPAEPRGQVSGRLAEEPFPPPATGVGPHPRHCGRQDQPIGRCDRRGARARNGGRGYADRAKKGRAQEMVCQQLPARAKSAAKHGDARSSGRQEGRGLGLRQLGESNEAIGLNYM